MADIEDDRKVLFEAPPVNSKFNWKMVPVWVMSKKEQTELGKKSRGRPALKRTHAEMVKFAAKGGVYRKSNNDTMIEENRYSDNGIENLPNSSQKDPKQETSQPTDNGKSEPYLLSIQSDIYLIIMHFTGR